MSDPQDPLADVVMVRIWNRNGRPNASDREDKEDWAESTDRTDMGGLEGLMDKMSSTDGTDGWTVYTNGKEFKTPEKCTTEAGKVCINKTCLA